MDGAVGWQAFRYITLPLLRPTMLFVTVITTIGYMKFFEEPFVMTQGGPLDSTLSVAFHAYNQFSFGNYGHTARDQLPALPGHRPAVVPPVPHPATEDVSKPR